MPTPPPRPRKKGVRSNPRDDRGRRLKKKVDDIMDSDVLRAVNEEVAADPRIKAKAKADPMSFLQGKGIQIPEGVEVTFNEGGSPGQKTGWQPDPEDERVSRLEKELDDIMNSDAFLRVAADVARDESVRSELEANPKGLLQRMGISIPRGVKVRFTEESPAVFCYMKCCRRVCSSWWFFTWCCDEEYEVCYEAEPKIYVDWVYPEEEGS